VSGAGHDRIVEWVRRSQRTAEEEGGNYAHVGGEDKAVVLKRKRYGEKDSPDSIWSRGVTR
jgi:hypothetical protein